MAGKKQTLALCGFMACGKTTLGRALARELGYAFVDTDELLFEKTRMTLGEMFAAGGETYFRDREHEVVCQAAKLEKAVISTGGGVMTFERNALMLAEHAEIIHIRRSFDLCYEHIVRRENRPIAGHKSCEEMLMLYQSRQAAYDRYAGLILQNDGTPEEALCAILRWLRTR